MKSEKILKKILSLSLCFISILAFNLNVSAHSKEDSVQALSKEKLEFLKKFPDLKKEFQKDSTRQLVETKEMYYRVESRKSTESTESVINTGYTTIKDSKFKFIPLTKEKCLKEVSNNQSRSLSSVVVGEDITSNSWIKLTLDVYKLSDGTYNVINFFEWLTNPLVALEDNISVTYDSRFTLSTKSIVGQYIYEVTNVNTGSTVTSSKTMSIKKGTGGAVGSFTLASSSRDYRPSNNRGYLSIYLLFGQSGSQTGATFGDYAHKQLSCVTEVDILDRKLSVKPSFAYDSAETAQVNVSQ